MEIAWFCGRTVCVVVEHKQREVLIMEELVVAEKIGELVLGAAINKLGEYKSKKEWSQLFVNTGEFFLKEVECGERIIEDISLLLSRENMKELAKKTDEGSKYLLRNTIYTGLKRLMLQYEIPAQEAEFYIANFMTVIMHEIEKNNPTAYQCAYLGEWREKEEKQLSQIKEAIVVMNTQLKEIQSKKVEVYSLDQIEVELALQTVNPSLDLSFFVVDDEVFKESLEDCINEEAIYISGQCKDETVYCVLNELRRLDTGKVVLVVRSEEAWQNLRIANQEHPELGGKILVPWFVSEQIYAIPNNTNVFVYGKEEYSVGKNVIKLRKRKRSTIVKKLEETGLSYEKAYALVDDTHGLYIPLKKKIIRGQYNVVPNWVNAEDDLIIPLVLCGQWTETEGDQVVLEDLCGKKYEQIIESLQPYMRGEDPLFIRFRVHGRTIYHLASVENAWDYLDDKVVIGDKRWNKYVECILGIISETDPVFNYPEEQQYYAEVLPEGKPFWSAILKKGLLRSFIMKAYYKKNKNSQNSIDSIVEKILEEITTLNQWLSIAGYFSLLCEASPKAVMHRLDDEWKNPTGLIEVFSKEKGDAFFSKNYYTHFIWGIEQFLLQNEYAAWAVRWFIKMHALNINYSISNSPEETLKQVFCTWHNVTVLSPEDKVYLVKEAFAHNYDIWNLIYSELPGRNMHMVGSPSKPLYRECDESLITTNADMWFANKEYLLLCLQHMDFDSARWIKLIEIADHFRDDLWVKIFEQLEYEIISMNDPEVIAIKDKIRDEIYRHRYFANSEWAMPEEKLKDYENVLNNIHTTNPVYEYAYLFEKEYDFPLLHPCPYSEDEKREVNNELRDKEIKEGITLFKELKLDIAKLIEICSGYEYSTLGKYLFDYYTEKKFDKDIFALLISNKGLKNIMTSYARIAYWENTEYLNNAVMLAKERGVDDEMLVSLLLIEEISAQKKPLINVENETVKSMYWKMPHHNYRDEENTYRFVLEETLKYADQVTIIGVLRDGIKYFAPTEILKVMEALHSIEVGVINSLTSYSLKEILKVLQDEYRNADECSRVAQLELNYRGLLEWEDMACFKRSLELSPKLFAEMISIIYKKDDGKEEEKNTLDEKIISSIFSLYYDAIFCPAESNGKVDKGALFAWIVEFKELLKQQNQTRLFTHFLGRIFAYSPIGEDGYYPHESIRDVIQEYGDQSLENEYVISVFNQRGVFSPTGGVAERELAKKYKKNADAVRVRYPKVASIYDRLSERYLYDADSERECEEYAGV